MISFIFDTSAFLSLGSANLLDVVIKNFKITTSPLVFHELDDFAAHDDPLGKIAQKVLYKREKITAIKPLIKEQLLFVSKIDIGRARNNRTNSLALQYSERKFLFGYYLRSL